MRFPLNLLPAALPALAAATFIGCGDAPDADAPDATTVAATDDHAGHDHDEEGAHDHSGWWCNEHGVPEGECARCAPHLIADFKAKGDWCAEHDRPESQCFLCDADRAEPFAARYVAKFGEAPPEPTE